MVINGQYGMFYRKMFGGKGYVFQSRFKSTIIENDSYLIKSIEKSEFSVRITKHGEVLGSESFLKMALNKHNRRQRPSVQSLGVQRKDDRFFEPVDKVLWEFENIHGVELKDIDTTTWTGKRLRGELLVLLRDKAGLKYKDINDICVFSNLSLFKLRQKRVLIKQKPGAKPSSPSPKHDGSVIKR